MIPTTNDLINRAALLVDTGWELPAEDFEALLSEFVEAATDKLQALRVVCKAAEGRSAAMKAEAAVYAAAAKAQGNIADRVKARAFALLEAAELAGETLPGARLQPNGGKPALTYAADFDASGLPFALQRVVIEPDADAIRAALAKGEAVPGVAIAPQGRHLRWVEGK